MPIRWTEVSDLETAARGVVSGTCLMADASKEADVTVLDLMSFLSENGYRSRYSWEDFLRGTAVMDEFLDYRPPKNRQTCAHPTKKTESK